MTFEEIRAIANAGRWAEVLDELDALPTSDERAALDAGWLRSRALRLLGRSAEALEEIQRVLPMAKEQGRRVVSILIEQSSCLGPRDSIGVLREAMAEADGRDAPNPRALIRLLLGRRLVEVGDLPGAEALIDEAVTIAPAVVERSNHALLQVRIARARGKPGSANEWITRALPHTEGVPRAQLLYELGYEAMVAGDAASALSLTRSGLDAIAGFDIYLSTRAALLGLLGVCQRDLGDAAEARTSVESAIAYAKQGGDRNNEQAFQADLGMMYLMEDELHAAAEQFAAARLGGVFRAPIQVLISIGSAAVAALRGDRDAFQAEAWPWLLQAPGTLPAIGALARGASRAAEGATTHGWRRTAVALRRLALDIWIRFSDGDEVANEEAALRELSAAGTPTLLGPFWLEEMLARGGFGAVYRAQAPGGVDVAVKVLLAEPKRAVEHLDNELRAVAALDHPGIVRLLHQGRVDRAAAVFDERLVEGSRWIALELAPGGTLDDHVGELSAQAIGRLLIGVLDALAHAHARGLLHLDVKPSNVLLRDGAPLLADFGLALQEGGSWRPAGTPEFMAPEQFGRDGSQIGPHTDLYAVGCLAISLLSGQPPFASSAGSVAELRRAHRTLPPELPPALGVPPGLMAWIRRALAKAPEDRFQTAADAARALMTVDLGDGDREGLGSRPSEQARTVVLAGLDDLGPVPTVPIDGAMPLPEPYVPVQWARSGKGRREPDLVEAGLGLFGLRSVPLVGRLRERGLLWATLRDVFERGSARVVVVTSPPGQGATSLAAWLRERALELGVATVVQGGSELPQPTGRRPVLWWLDDPSPAQVAVVEQHIDAPVPVMIVASGASGLGDSLLDRDAIALELGPLPDSELRHLVSSLLPLDPLVTDAVTAFASGSPGIARHVVADLVLRSRLRRGIDGWTVRGAIGAEIPSSLAELWTWRVGSLCRGIPGAQPALVQLARSGTPPPPPMRLRLLAAGLAIDGPDGLELDHALCRHLLSDAET